MRNLLFALISLLIFSACTSGKDVIYFNDVVPEVDMPITQTYDHKIQKDDKLSIRISSKSPDLVAPFTTGALSAVDTERNPTGSTNSSISYLVDINGNIVFPILGTIYVEGLTHAELAHLIEQKLKDGGYIMDATVSVELENFKITFLGAVGSPNVIDIKSNRVTIFEAIAMAGDVSIQGIRDSVSIVRENNGSRYVTKVDLTSKDIFSSPYYYLQPNDMVYVDPNNAILRTRDPRWFIVTNFIALATFLTSMALLIF